MEHPIPKFPEFGKSAILLCTAIALYLAYYVTVVSKRSKRPPGPTGIPLLGNLLQMVKDPHLKFSQWARTYGNMYTIYLANRATLIVSDVKWTKELFGTMASTGKFKTDTILLLSQGPYGVANTEGSAWNEQRQFCIRSLRELGYGKSSSMEPRLLQEVHDLCSWIKKMSKDDSQGVVDLSRVLSQSTANALWALVTGERLKLEDATSGDLWNYWMDSIQYSTKTGLTFFPWLKYLAPKLSGYVDLKKSNEAIHAFIEGKFDEHKRTFVEGQARDLVDMYIEQMNKTNESGNSESSFFGKTGVKNSVATVVEMFLAGGESMNITIRWAAIYLSQNGEAQRKLQSEIDEVLGPDGNPSLTDQNRMPYTEAVIMETFRLSSLAALGGPHELLEDVSFQGFALPKGLILMANLYHIHHDPEIWGDPDEFRPERFLTGDGRRLREYLVPFQAGKRQCPGEGLAKDALFLFLVKLFQQFRFSPALSVSKEDYFKPDVGIVLLPRCSKFRIASR